MDENATIFSDGRQKINNYCNNLLMHCYLVLKILVDKLAL